MPEKKLSQLDKLSKQPPRLLRKVEKLYDRDGAVDTELLDLAAKLPPEALRTLRTLGRLEDQQLRLALQSIDLAQYKEVEDARFEEISRKIDAYTLSSRERRYALVQAVRYLAKNQIEGCFVECGVWRGGSMMAVAEVLKDFGMTDRSLYLFDTFAGMSEPTEIDIESHSGKTADDLMGDRSPDQGYMVYAGLDEVKSNLGRCDYPVGNINYVVGKVEDTLPVTEIGPIALLRLDTDWYESTKMELEYLFPKLVRGGVLIVDDYGHFDGARRAVDEYFELHNIPVLLNRIDYTGRLVLKTV